MIDYKNRLDTFIASFCPDETGDLRLLEEYAVENFVPIIKRGSRAVLRTFLQSKRPSVILEIGTAIGFSAILMANELDFCRIATIEGYPPRIELARQNIEKYDRRKQISLLEGDAIDILKQLASEKESEFDFVFLDAAKAQYIVMLPDIIKLMKKGAVLFADNVLQDSCIMESRFAIEKRDRTIHSRMREYLYEVTHNESLNSSIIPVDDGVAVSIKL